LPWHDSVKRERGAPLLLIILIVLALLFLGGGFGMRGHSSYGSYSTPGIGLGGILLIILVVLLLTGSLHL
jgi:hypothetical protein